MFTLFTLLVSFEAIEATSIEATRLPASDYPRALH